MHIGLIVGIGPAATDHHCRYLLSALSRAGHDLTLTMAHADTPALLATRPMEMRTLRWKSIDG